MAPRLIRDLSDSSGYWAAVWTMCVMPDVHVICDAPVGCFNLVATAVPDYTDSIPHIENITPATMTETEVGGKGTAEKVKWTYEGLRDAGTIAGKKVIVVSTAESEMIGSDLSQLVKQLGEDTTFFYSNSLADDEWVGRDKVLKWLWAEYGAPDAPAPAPKPRSVNIIGPTYGCFNAPSDLEELRRLIAGAGGEIHMVYPYESQLAETPRLAEAAVNVVLYREFGRGLAEQLGRPLLYAPMGMRNTNAFVRELGQLLGTETQAEAFIAHERRTTLQAVWDLWRGPQGDWFGTTDIGIVAGHTHAAGLAQYLGEELGMKIAFVGARPLRPGDPDNEAVRKLIHARAPAFVFGSINEKIYLSEAGARFTTFFPAAFPGPIVRRAVGTPFLGYRGAVYILQEIVNGLYNVLFNFLPVDGAYPGGSRAAGGPPAGQGQSPGNLPWLPEARALLDAALEQLPFIPRISASREIQMQVEALARSQQLGEVTVELVQRALAARGN